jgi:hypothetical protein
MASAVSAMVASLRNMATIHRRKRGLPRAAVGREGILEIELAKFFAGGLRNRRLR